jgi:hypothetical protein
MGVIEKHVTGLTNWAAVDREKWLAHCDKCIEAGDAIPHEVDKSFYVRLEADMSVCIVGYAHGGVRVISAEILGFSPRRAESEKRNYMLGEMSPSYRNWLEG